MQTIYHNVFNTRLMFYILLCKNVQTEYLYLHYFSSRDIHHLNMSLTISGLVSFSEGNQFSMALIFYAKSYFAEIILKSLLQCMFKDTTKRLLFRGWKQHVKTSPPVGSSMHRMHFPLATSQRRLVPSCEQDKMWSFESDHIKSETKTVLFHGV